MNLDMWNSLISRLFFFAGFLLIAIGIIDRLLNFSGYTILPSGYTSGRMLELAGIMLIVVVALLLRQIREQLAKKA